MAIDFELLQDSPHLLDILVQMEDVLDSMDVYVFKNWIKGEVAEGPLVRRYWLDMTLRYPYDEMPDPRAALRLLKHGVRVDFEKGRYATDERNVVESVEEADGEEEDTSNMVWLVRISIPRRLVVQMDDAQHDFYDEEVDVDQVEDAKDDGLDDESAYQSDENDIDGTGADPADDPSGDPAAAPQPGAPQ